MEAQAVDLVEVGEPSDSGPEDRYAPPGGLVQSAAGERPAAAAGAAAPRSLAGTSLASSRKHEPAAPGRLDPDCGSARDRLVGGGRNLSRSLDLHARGRARATREL